jgi:hypothetical protein
MKLITLNLLQGLHYEMFLFAGAFWCDPALFTISGIGLRPNKLPAYLGSLVSRTKFSLLRPTSDTESLVKCFLDSRSLWLILRHCQYARVIGE